MNERDIKEFEMKRMKGIRKFLFGILLLVLSLIYYIFVPIVFPNLFDKEKIDFIIYIYVALPWIFIFGPGMSYSIYSKDFEHEFKKRFISHIANDIIQNIIQNDGKITWVSDIYSLDEDKEYDDSDTKKKLREYRKKKNIENADDEDKKDDFFDFNLKTIKKEGDLNFSKVFKGFSSFDFKGFWDNVSILLEDFFCGTYKGADFISVEAKISSDIGRNSYKVFDGIIIEIKTDNDFPPTLVKRKLMSYPNVPSGYKKINIKENFFSSKCRVYVRNNEHLPNLPAQFYNYISLLKKDIVFGFSGNRAIIMIPTTKDMFKLGSIFKRIDDEKQYMKFRSEFIFMLNLIENLSNIINGENI